jgi:hypothetical protein
MAVTGQDVGPVFGCSKREEKSALKSVPPSLLQPATVTATPRKARSPTICVVRAATVLTDPTAISFNASTVANSARCERPLPARSGIQNAEARDRQIGAPCLRRCASSTSSSGPGRSRQSWSAPGSFDGRRNRCGPLGAAAAPWPESDQTECEANDNNGGQGDPVEREVRERDPCLHALIGHRTVGSGVTCVRSVVAKHVDGIGGNQDRFESVRSDAYREIRLINYLAVQGQSAVRDGDPVAAHPDNSTDNAGEDLGAY